MADFKSFFPGNIIYSFGLVYEGISEGSQRTRIARAKLARLMLNDILNGIRGLSATWANEGSTPDGADAIVEDLESAVNRLRPFFVAIEEETPPPIERGEAQESCRTAKEKAEELRDIESRR